MSALRVEVAVLGAGPTGLTLANLLGAAGVTVALVERNGTTVREPRAVSIDDESLRTMQAAGLIEEVLADVALDYGSHYLTPKGALFARVEPASREYGYPKRNAFAQPRLEAALREGLGRHPSLRPLFGHACGTFAQDDEGVDLTLAGPGRELRLRADYVVACDGASSPTRKAIGATLEGSTYAQRWLIVDLASTRERLRQTRVLCDPARPTITLPGPHGTRRYEFMLREGETDEVATDPAFVRALLAARGPDADAPVVRRQVYAFHARVADRWRRGRVFLAGDAAHLSPPFAGQGMNSGLRDAGNLAWKLAEVVRGRLGPGLLDSYEAERRPHAAALIAMAVNMGRVMMPTSRVQAALVQTGFRAARLLPAVHAYFAQMKYKPKPHYEAGFVAPGDAPGLTGRMLPQPELEGRDGARARLDDLAGPGFALLAYGPEAQRTLRAAEDADLGLADLRRLAILPARVNEDRTSPIPGFRDAGDGLAGFAGLRDLPGADLLLLLRPDRYVAAAARVTDGAGIAAFAAAVRGLAGRTWRGSRPNERGAVDGRRVAAE